MWRHLTMKTKLHEIPSPKILLGRDPDHTTTFVESVTKGFWKSYKLAIERTKADENYELNEHQKVAIGHLIGRIPFDVDVTGDSFTLTLQGSCSISWDGHRFLVNDITYIQRAKIRD